LTPINADTTLARDIELCNSMKEGAMTNAGRVVSILALCATIVAQVSGNGARAASEGTTLAGRPFVSGGVTQDERDALSALRSRYALEVVTAARGSGAYLAGVHVTVIGENGRKLLDTALDGPWLLVDLAPGRYTVDATLGGQAQSRTVTIPAGGRREAYFYFDVEAEVVPRAAGGRASPWPPGGRRLARSSAERF
jgi:hypothetical protein